MDDLGFNKIAGAVLAVGLGFMVLMKLPGVVMGDEGEEIAYKVGSIETGGGDVVEIELPFPQADWVAAMDESKGAKVFKKCKSCHNVDPGGPNGTGPGLYGVVGNDIASHDGFNYSAALNDLSGEWTYEALDKYLTKPSAYAPGTKMIFVGLRKAEDRAAVIQYLRLADPEPSPLPVAKSAVPEGEDAVPEGEDGVPEGEDGVPEGEDIVEAPVVENEIVIEEPAPDPTE